MVNNMRNLKYRVMSLRLSDEVIEELNNRRKNFKSWNLLLKQLLGIKTEFKLRQKNERTLRNKNLE